MTFTLVIGGLLAIAATVLLCIKVLPAKFDGTFSKKVLQIVHDYFNFKKLYLEAVLKVVFTFLTIFTFIGGVFYATVGNFFQLIGNIINAIDYGYMGDWIFTRFFSNIFAGLAFAVVVPVVLRLLYEGVVMFILLVKNVIEINKKTK